MCYNLYLTIISYRRIAGKATKELKNRTVKERGRRLVVGGGTEAARQEGAESSFSKCDHPSEELRPERRWGGCVEIWERLRAED